jgi:hypothetical protein
VNEEDKLPLIVKLNNEVKDLRRLTTNLYTYSCLDAASLASLKINDEQYLKDRQHILRFMEAANKLFAAYEIKFKELDRLINFQGEKIKSLEQRLAEASTTGAVSSPKSKSVLELVHNRIRQLIKPDNS